MKKSKLNLLVLSLLITTGLFTSCAKEEMNKDDQQDPECKETTMLAQWWEHRVSHGGCYNGGLFCRDKDWWDCLADDNFENLQLLDNEVMGTGSIIIEGGEEVLFFEFSKNKLTEESINQLINERVMQLEDFEFDKDLVKELYQKADLEYTGIPVNISNGYYDIQVVESADGTLPSAASMTIQVKINMKESSEQGKLRILIL